MERVEKILKELKPKASAYGFSRKELESVASVIDGNLDLGEDASDEDVNAAIGKAVDAVIPFLKLAQASANRAIEAFRKSKSEDDDDDDDSVKAGSKTKKEKPNDGDGPKQDGNKSPEWANAMMNQLKELQGKIANLEVDRVSNSRKSKLDALLKDTGSFGNSYLRNFSRMQFASEDEFEDFLSGVKDDLKTFNQERANAGLNALGTAPGASKKDLKDEVKPLDDNELDDLVDIM